MRRSMLLTAAVLAAASVPLTPARAAGAYPTVDVAEYVFACMKANGESRSTLERCSCSIDVIASIVPYEVYVTAETFKQMSQVTGEKGVLFRNNVAGKHATTELKRAQTEADIRCF